MQRNNAEDFFWSYINNFHFFAKSFLLFVTSLLITNLHEDWILRRLGRSDSAGFGLRWARGKPYEVGPQEQSFEETNHTFSFLLNILRVFWIFNLCAFLRTVTKLYNTTVLFIQLNIFSYVFFFLCCSIVLRLNINNFKKCTFSNVILQSFDILFTCMESDSINHFDIFA